jgi:putative addiction module component (TIGR02574 family)
MNPAADQLLQAALALSEKDRIELIEALLASRDLPNALPFDRAWLPEIERRSAEIETGTVSTESWSIVRARVRERVEGRPGD